MTPYMKAWRAANKDKVKAYNKAWKEEHKEYVKSYNKSYYKDNKDKCNALNKEWRETHKAERVAYKKSDVNSEGTTKASIRLKSYHYLTKHGKKIKGYEIHHCCTYNEPYKFIYCSKEMHLKIHQYLRDNNIDADSNHYEQIKHLLDETVIVYGV